MENNKKYILGLGHPFIDLTGSITKELSHQLIFYYLGLILKLDKR